MTTEASWAAASNASACEVNFGHGTVQADIDPEPGKEPSHPSPHDLLDGALAACTTLTLQLYIKRKAMDVQSLRVEVTHSKDAGVYKMDRSIHVVGNVSEEQRASLLRIAEACPVHKTLLGEIGIVTRLESEA